MVLCAVLIAVIQSTADFAICIERHLLATSFFFYLPISHKKPTIFYDYCFIHKVVKRPLSRH